MKQLYPLRRTAAVLVGVVFLVSGLLKLQGPAGTMLIVTEYAKFLNLRFLIPAAKLLGMMLGLVEGAIGAALVTGVCPKASAVGTYLMLALFLPLTLLLWIRNPEMDCGCFGEALHLTHAQSFWKNVALLLLSLFAFTPFRDLNGVVPRRKWVAAGMAFLSLVFVAVYSSRHLPLADFTPFDWGAELEASLEDEVAGDNHYQIAFIYEKKGRQGTFFLDTLPDSTWTFVKADTLFRQGPARPRYPRLGIRTADGDYIDRQAAEGPVVVFSLYAPAKADVALLEDQVRQVWHAGARPMVLAASAPGQADIAGLPASLPLYFSDYKTLVALNRANGGGAYFHAGELIDKWDPAHFPAMLADDLAVDPVNLSTQRIIRRRIRAQGFCLYLAALLLLV